MESLRIILSKNNFNKNDSKIIAEILTEGSLRGYPRHGIERVFDVLDGVKKQTINPQASPQVLRETAAMAIIDGQLGAGHPLAYKAMLIAIQKAKHTGIGTCGLINAGHIGILSYYSELASHRGCLGLVMSVSSPITVVSGGKIKTFGTNPVSYSFPTTKPKVVTADFSTSKISRSTLKTYQKLKRKLPLGVAVDINGKPTQDSEQAFLGGLNTIDGEIKGSLVSMLVSILAGPLIGGVINPHVTDSVNMAEKTNKGELFIAFDISMFSDLGAFRKKIESLLTFIHKQKATFRTPGICSHIRRAKGLANGIIVPNTLNKLFAQYKIKL